MTDTAQTGESACHPAWLLVLDVIGITLIQSAFTEFCPVYFLLDKTGAPETKPVSEVLGTTALQLMRQPVLRGLCELQVVHAPSCSRAISCATMFW